MIILLLLIQIAVLLFSVILHEVAHGYAALRCGDPTAYEMGRLSFDPRRHIDIFGTIILPLILILMRAPLLFAWAKPVPVNPYYFRDYKRDMVIVSLAGPLSNIGVAIFFGLILRVIPGYGILTQILSLIVGINLILAFFNLIPVPPLDGSNILAPFLPFSVREKYILVGRFGFIIIYFLLILGLGHWLFKFVRLVFIILTGKLFF